MKNISRTLTTALVISLGSVSASQARIITEISPPGGPGSGDIVCAQVQTPVDTPSPNNDNSVDPSPNQILNFPGLSCTPKTFKFIAPIDTKLFVEPSGGTTEYYFTETVVNNTGYSWTGFYFQLGSGIDKLFDPFDRPGRPYPISIAIPKFDTPDRDPNPNSSQFKNLVHRNFSLWWSDGSVAPGETVDFMFSLDVPDDFAGNNIYEDFTIRQTPVVPEPPFVLSSVAIGIIVSGRVVFRNRKKRQDVKIR